MLVCEVPAGLTVASQLLVIQPQVTGLVGLSTRRTMALATQGSPGSPPISAVADDWIRPDPSAAPDPLVGEYQEQRTSGPGDLLLGRSVPVPAVRG